MKKIFIAMAVALLLSVLFLPSQPVFAGCDIDGRSFGVTIGGVEYRLTFQQGPFGPGCGGTAALTADGQNIDNFNFGETASGLVRIYGFGDFFYDVNRLIWIQTELILRE